MYLQYYGGLPFAHGINYENGSQVLDDWCDFENIFILMISSSLPNKNYQLKKFSIPAVKIVKNLIWICYYGSNIKQQNTGP